VRSGYIKHVKEIKPNTLKSLLNLLTWCNIIHLASYFWQKKKKKLI